MRALTYLVFMNANLSPRARFLAEQIALRNLRRARAIGDVRGVAVAARRLASLRRGV